LERIDMNDNNEFYIDNIWENTNYMYNDNNELPDDLHNKFYNSTVPTDQSEPNMKVNNERYIDNISENTSYMYDNNEFPDDLLQPPDDLLQPIPSAKGDDLHNNMTGEQSSLIPSAEWTEPEKLQITEFMKCLQDMSVYTNDSFMKGPSHVFQVRPPKIPSLPDIFKKRKSKINKKWKDMDDETFLKYLSTLKTENIPVQNNVMDINLNNLEDIANNLNSAYTKLQLQDNKSLLHHIEFAKLVKINSDRFKLLKKNLDKSQRKWKNWLNQNTRFKYASAYNHLAVLNLTKDYPGLKLLCVDFTTLLSMLKKIREVFTRNHVEQWSS